MANGRQGEFDRGRPLQAAPPIPAAERWLPIEGWPGYDVSDWGRVRSWWGAGGGSKGRRGIVDTPKLIGGHILRSGHRSVVLYRNHSSEKRTAGVHVLALEAFAGPRPSGLVACHRNGNPSDNRPANLRWDTYKSNQIDVLKHGGRIGSVIAESDVPELWRRIVEGQQSTTIAKEMGITPAAVASVRSGISWTHVTQTLPGWPLARVTDHEGKEPIYVPEHVAQNPDELWGQIADWPAYQISTWGRIQTRWEQVTGGRRGEWRVGDTWKERAIYPNRDGHCFLWMSNGFVRKMRYVHQLVLTVFACPRPPGYVACHIDGDKTNNHANNLRWDTVKSNARDRVKHAGS